MSMVMLYAHQFQIVFVCQPFTELAAQVIRMRVDGDDGRGHIVESLVELQCLAIVGKGGRFPEVAHVLGHDGSALLHQAETVLQFTAHGQQGNTLIETFGQA